MINDSLAAPKPPESGEPEEHGDERPRRNHKGDKTLAELAEQFGVHHTQITEWKRYFLEWVADVFGGTTHKPDAPALKVLHA